MRTQPAPDPCAGLPGPAGALCDIPDAVAGGVTGLVGDAAGTVLEQLSTSTADSARFFVQRLAAAIDQTTQVDVSEPWFLRQYALMFGVSALLTFALLLLAVLKQVVRGSWTGAVRSATVYYLAAVVASAFAPAGVYLLLELSDLVTAGLVRGSGQDTDTFFATLGTALGGLSLAPGGAGAFTVLATSLFTLVCAVVLWVELLLRSALVYVALLFAAPTFSGLVDRSLWRHSRRWLSFVVAVVFAKPVVVAVLLLGSASTGGASTSDRFSSVFVGLAVLLVAIFCVGLLFRVVPTVGDQLAGVAAARRELKQATPTLPLPPAGLVVRQSIQRHLLQGRAPAVAAGARLVHRTPATPSARSSR